MTPTVASKCVTASFLGFWALVERSLIRHLFASLCIAIRSNRTARVARGPKRNGLDFSAPPSLSAWPLPLGLNSRALHVVRCLGPLSGFRSLGKKEKSVLCSPALLCQIRGAQLWIQGPDPVSFHRLPWSHPSSITRLCRKAPEFL